MLKILENFRLGVGKHGLLTMIPRRANGTRQVVPLLPSVTPSGGEESKNSPIETTPLADRLVTRPLEASLHDGWMG